MDLGTIGLNVETTGEESAKQRLDSYLATVRRVMSELQRSVQEQKVFAEIRSSLASKEVRDNMAYWKALQSLDKQKMQSMKDEEQARKRLLQENMRTTSAMQSLGNQREASIAAEARAVEQAAQKEEQASKRLLQENMRVTSALQSLGNQREAAYAAEARAAEVAAAEVVAAEQRKYREAENKANAIASLDRQRQAAYAAEARAAENAAREVAAAEQRKYREAERLAEAMTSLHNQREAAYAAEARAAENAAREVAAAEQRKYREAERLAEAMTSLHNQREAAHAAEARAAEVASREAAAAEYRRYREAERIANAMASLDEQRKAAHAAEQAEAQQLENQYRQLAASLDPVVRAQQRYDSSTEVLNRALREKVITEQQHLAAIKQLNAQMALAGHAVNQYGQVLQGANRTAFRASRDGLQQLGYQVGDFAVQLQYGTPFLIAFAQQGSQLLQIFGPWGAIAGAVLAVTAALGTAFYTSSDKADTLEDSLRDLDTTMTDVRDTMDLLNDDDLSFRFGDLTSDVDELAASMLLLDQAASLKNLQETLDRLSKENLGPSFLQRLSAGVAAGSGAGLGAINYEDFLGAFREENFADFGFAIGLETFDGVMKAIDESAAAGDTKAVVRSLRELYSQAVPDMETATEVVRSGGLEMLKAFSDVALTTAETTAALNGSADASRTATEQAEIEARERERTAAALERQEEAYERNVQSGVSVWNNLQNELDLQIAINKYGEDSNRVREIRNQQEAETIRLRLLQLYASEGINAEEQLIIDNTMMVVEELINARNAADDAALAADRIKDGVKGAVQEAILLRDALAQVQSAGVSRSDQAAILRAQIIAAREGRSVEGVGAGTETALVLGRAGATVDQIAAAAQEAAAGAEEVARLREELINARNAADDAALAADRIKSGVKGAVQEAILLRDALAQVQSAGVSRSDQAAILRAQITASREGRSVEGAGAGTETALVLGRAGATVDQIAAAAQEAAAGAEEVSRLREELSALNKVEGGGAKRVADGLNEARQLFEETRTEAEQYAMEIERINELHGQFPDIVSEDVVNRALKQLREGLDETAQFARRLEEAFASTATSIVTESESARDAIAGLLQMMAEMAIQAAFMGLFKGLLGPLGWVFSPGALPSANGNVFSGGNMVPFQDGGVVNGTSYFPMGGGRTGMMGEAGPEAIMPLRRDSKGRLGVQTEGETQRIVLEVRAEEGEMFVPRVRQISGNVAVQVSTATARAQNQTFGATLTDFDQRGTS